MISIIVFVMWYLLIGVIIAVYNFINFSSEVDDLCCTVQDSLSRKETKVILFIFIVLRWIPFIVSKIKDCIIDRLEK